MRRLAAQTLGDLKDKGSVELLIEASIQDSDNVVRQYAIIALGKIGDRKAIPVVIEAIIDERKNIQLAALHSLKSLTGEDFGIDYEKWSEWNKNRR